jgi:hypothetical protein
VTTAPFDRIDFIALREAIEASWSPATSYGGVWKSGNPALGQCYPTSRVVQHFVPQSEVVRGTVWTRGTEETHFWNVLAVGDVLLAIDLKWEQFPTGSVVTSYELLDHDNPGDGPATIARCELLLTRVLERLARRTDT